MIGGVLVASLSGQPHMNAQIQQRHSGKVIRNAKEASQERDGQTNNASVYEASFTKIWETVQKRFYDANLHGVDWNQVGETYHARLAAVKDRGEFEALMNQMLGELHASHTAFVMQEDAEYYLLRAVSTQDTRQGPVEHIGIMGRREGGEYLVSAVLNGGPAEKAHIHVGDHLILADGKPFTSASCFRGKAGAPVQIQLKHNGEAALLTVTVTPIKENMLRSFLDATMRSARMIESGGKHIAYVHLWTMAHETFRSALEISC